MPELPEVETVRRGLETWLVGRKVVHAEHHGGARASEKYARLEQARGQRIVAIQRRGKFLLLPLSGGDELVIHLGMSGRLGSERPARHLRATLTLDGRAPRELYFEDARRFGRFLLVQAGQYASLPTLAHMGPEPLDPGYGAAPFVAALARSRTPIKTYLLSQKPLAGVGNIYADEALWRAKIHPSEPSLSLSKPRARTLLAAIQQVLRAAIEAQGTTLRDYRTVRGERGHFQDEIAVYGREGRPCQRCGHGIERLVLAGRSASFCPRCQAYQRP